MFKSREHFTAGQDAGQDAGAGAGADGAPASGAAALSFAQIFHVLPRKIGRNRPLGEMVGAWNARIAHSLVDIDLTPDLAQDIGSAQWFRGMGTMLGLALAAISFWPDFAPLEAAPAMHIDDQARDEFRSQMIMPLALGGDSGRHMGATAAVVPLKAAPERPRIEMVATLVQGDSFGRMLQRAGVGAGEAERVVSLVASAVPLEDIESGTRIDITLGRRTAPNTPRPLDALAFRARFDLELTLERRLGALVLDPRPIRVDATPLRIRGKVGSSLYRSARAAGAPMKAVQQYLRTLNDSMRIDSDVEAGDEFDIILSYRRAATGETQAGELLYAGLERSGKPVAQLLRWGNDGRFFEASGVGEQRSGLLTPVNGRVTSGFGMRRHPILGYTRMHAGLDFKAGYGAPIYAVTDATVIFAGRHGGHGNFVKLNHGGGFGTGYGHMSRIAVSPGMRVRRGQVIGYVGSTGLSTGPHLHYEMYRNGQVVNPASVQFVTRAALTGAELRNFRAQLAQLKQVEPGTALIPLVQEKPRPTVPVREIDRLEQPGRIG